jgi:hypothetical protein
MLTAKIVGAVELTRRLGQRIPSEIRTRVGATVERLGFKLERKVKQEKLEGQVLKRRSGTLVRSVNTRFASSLSRYESSVGTSLKYGRAWELGFKLPARTIKARYKEALFWAGARHPVKAVHQPARREAARPFLKPALREMKPEIRAALADSLRGL